MLIQGKYTTITINIGPFSKTQPKYLPPNPGVYLLLDGEELNYIGRASHLYGRVKNHRKRKRFTDVLFLMIPSSWERKIIEFILINKFAPKLNKTAGLVKLRDLTMLLKNNQECFK